MRIRRNKIITLSDLLVWLGMFCVVSFALLEHVSISVPLFSMVKMPLLYVGGLCIISQLNILARNFLKKRYFYILGILIIMCLLLLISMLANGSGSGGYSAIRGTLRLILYLVELFLLVVVLAESGKRKSALKFMFRYLLLLVAVTDVLLLTRWVVFGTERHESYLVGTKFTVVYMHMNLAVLWFMHRQERSNRKRVSKWLIVAAAVMFLWISIRVDCLSGVLGTIVLVIILVWLNTGKQGKEKLLSSPLLFCLCLIISVAFPFIVESILNIPFVTYIIEEVMGRSNNLTGRMDIYENFVKQMQGHWLYGYGYGRGNEVSVSLFGYANAQNALLHWILQTGVPATLVFGWLMSAVVKQLNRCNMDKVIQAGPLLALLYVYVFLGMVETTFSMSYILWLAVLFMINNSSDEEAMIIESDTA